MNIKLLLLAVIQSVSLVSFSADSVNLANQFNFVPIENGLVTEPLEFIYDLATDKNSLAFGPFSINPSSVQVTFSKAEKLDADVAKFGDIMGSNVLLFQWPEEIIPAATIEAINRRGDQIWKLDLNINEMESWKDKKYDLAYRLPKAKKGAKSKAKEQNPILDATYGILNVDAEAFKVFKGKGLFKFCFKYQKESYFTRLCTPNFEMKFKGNKITSIKQEETVQTARVLIRNESASLSGNVLVKTNEPFRFFGELANGYSVEFYTKPLDPPLVDFIADPKDPNVFILRGHTVVPFGSTRLNPIERRGFFYEIDWLPTIGDLRHYWELTLPRENPEMLIPGLAGGVFRQRMKVSRVPTAEVRPELIGERYMTTYSNSPVVAGKIKGDYKLKSTQKFVENQKGGKFVWTMDAPEAPAENRSLLEVTGKDGTWVTSANIYRGYANELSARSTGVLSAAGDMVLLGEVAYNHWFENFFGWENYWVASRRWGISFKQFQSLADFKEENSNQKIGFQNTTFELRYRLTPGIWGRDESWGLLAGYQDVKLFGVGGPMYGGGFFWARSMPKLFDDLFNYLPYMNYPKWVDLEFIYYPISGRASNTLGINYAMNFHGKVLWTDTVFGEAGFGMKFYDVIDQVKLRQALVQSFYGTVGLGISF